MIFLMLMWCLYTFFVDDVVDVLSNPEHGYLLGRRTLPLSWSCWWCSLGDFEWNGVLDETIFSAPKSPTKSYEFPALRRAGRLGFVVVDDVVVIVDVVLVAIAFFYCCSQYWWCRWYYCWWCCYCLWCCYCWWCCCCQWSWVLSGVGCCQSWSWCCYNWCCCCCQWYWAWVRVRAENPVAWSTSSGTYSTTSTNFLKFRFVKI